MLVVCSTELQTVQDALNIDSLNLGVGTLHEPSDTIYLTPFCLQHNHLSQLNHNTGRSASG